MAQNKEKIVQSYIQALLEVSNKLIEANNLASSYKAKFLALNPDLTGTGLSSGQLTAVNTFLSSLNTLANDIVVTTVQSKDVPSQGTKALD